ncbi:MAG TPA: hypothetical protein VF820_05035 [Patescibacteria group bacterium]
MPGPAQAERVVGFRSGDGRHAVANRGIEQASSLVHTREEAVIGARPAARWNFVVPVIGSRLGDTAYVGIGTGLLATEGRVSGRLRHTAFEGWTNLDMGAMFGRFRVNSLNLNGELPWIERAILTIQSSKDLKDLENTSVVGGVVKFGVGVVAPVLKFFTRDSWRSKIIALPGDIAIGALGGAANESVLFSYFGGPELSVGSFENGLDAGDQVADLATMAGYLEFMRNPSVPEARKKRIARAFIDHYDMPPTAREIARHERSLRRHPVLQAAHGGLESAHHVVREVEQYVDIPFSGVLAGATKLTRGSDPANPPRSIHDAVDTVLTTAEGKMEELRATLAQAGRLRRVGHVDAEVALATWQYRLGVARLLNDVYTQARQLEPDHRSRFLPRQRRG